LFFFRGSELAINPTNLNCLPAALTTFSQPASGVHPASSFASLLQKTASSLRQGALHSRAFARRSFPFVSQIRLLEYHERNPPRPGRAMRQSDRCQVLGGTMLQPLAHMYTIEFTCWNASMSEGNINLVNDCSRYCEHDYVMSSTRLRFLKMCMESCLS
jgi:hypothetical protein